MRASERATSSQFSRAEKKTNSFLLTLLILVFVVVASIHSATRVEDQLACIMRWYDI